MDASGIREIPYLPRSSDAISAELPDASGGINIELWDENGAVPTLASSGCNRMGDTNFYAWPISGLSSVPDVRSFFHWRMSSISGTDVAEGAIILFTVEGTTGKMPSLNDPSSYLV